MAGEGGGGNGRPEGRGYFGAITDVDGALLAVAEGDAVDPSAALQWPKWARDELRAAYGDIVSRLAGQQAARASAEVLKPAEGEPLVTVSAGAGQSVVAQDSITDDSNGGGVAPSGNGVFHVRHAEGSTLGRQSLLSPEGQALLDDLASAVRPQPQQHGMLLGPDYFGLHVTPPPPVYFPPGFRIADLPTKKLPALFRALDLANGRVPMPRDLSGLTAEDRQVWVDKRFLEGRLEDLVGRGIEEPLNLIPPELMEAMGDDHAEMPMVFHAIWLGSPLASFDQKRKEFQRNIANLARAVQGRDWMVVLWTDQPRSAFQDPEPGGGIANMLDWARQNHIILLNDSDFFNSRHPSSLDPYYRMEKEKGIGAGWAAASDILRIRILLLLGGIYTDGDNQFITLDGLKDLFLGMGFAVHYDGGYANSALLSLRNHPFMRQYAAQILENYLQPQDALYRQDQFHIYSWETRTENENLVSRPPLRARRQSVIKRTGPDNLRSVATRLGFPMDEDHMPKLVQTSMGSANSWLAGGAPLRPPRPFARDDAPRVLQQAVAVLVRDVLNRPGDLHLTAVAPLIEGLPDPKAGWEAIVAFLRSRPEIAGRVRTVTDLVLYQDDGGIKEDRVRLPDSLGSVLWTDPTSTATWRLGERMRRARFAQYVQGSLGARHITANPAASDMDDAVLAPEGRPLTVASGRQIGRSFAADEEWEQLRLGALDPHKPKFAHVRPDGTGFTWDDRTDVDPVPWQAGTDLYVAAAHGRSGRVYPGGTGHSSGMQADSFGRMLARRPSVRELGPQGQLVLAICELATEAQQVADETGRVVWAPTSEIVVLDDAGVSVGMLPHADGNRGEWRRFAPSARQAQTAVSGYAGFDPSPVARAASVRPGEAAGLRQATIGKLAAGSVIAPAAGLPAPARPAMGDPVPASRRLHIEPVLFDQEFELEHLLMGGDLAESAIRLAKDMAIPQLNVGQDIAEMGREIAGLIREKITSQRPLAGTRLVVRVPVTNPAVTKLSPHLAQEIANELSMRVNLKIHGTEVGICPNG